LYWGNLPRKIDFRSDWRVFDGFLIDYCGLSYSL
jgi:hypothetical protein